VHNSAQLSPAKLPKPDRAKKTGEPPSTAKLRKLTFKLGQLMRACQFANQLWIGILNGRLRPKAAVRDSQKSGKKKPAEAGS
jgi:hypothetical protein